MVYFTILSPEYCYLPYDEGFGQGISARYFYNSDTNRCELFLYKGNGGNRNNFMTNSECERTCKPRIGPFYDEEEGIEV